MPAFLAILGLGASRLVLWIIAISIWLISRPGGWAVLAVLALVGVKLLPAK
ncbi:hypothetical protein OE699_10300 [Sedimentimonas flavescens]|uniref:Uncharacterized protein n=1 Tax=Sedimentimonas flavescens TaxID=2851012 RepID=A0ABT2ZZR6_9RHOB|nr:hypothetical protein [Sedimentimonas flavescens]MBW0158562.1 hypothetical protein [Sedimentimonas flavescens]MCT2540895.1 hypothetical protein [Sedimentimonas flavescens]MCV2879247.1 hypothetical protein [Sedimentimonas flavescens]WBL32903.1 hypothetical protein O5O51_14480 [Sinirhodobacter sp. HNIBRBA609]